MLWHRGDGCSARDAFKLALPGFRHSVDWWGLPARLECPLAPDRGALGVQTRSLAARMAFGRLREPWVQELKPSSPSRTALGWVAGGLRPAAKVLAGSSGDSLGAFRCMMNSCPHIPPQTSSAALGCAFGKNKKKHLVFGVVSSAGLVGLLDGGRDER